MTSNRYARRSWGVVAATTLLLAGFVAASSTGGAATGFAFTRFAGEDRYETAAKAAVDTFGKSDVVIITSGANFPDALAGGYAAGLAGVPILLTTQRTLPTFTSNAITTLGATKALIIGGTGAVGPEVDAALKAKGLSTNRLAGGTRYETARLVAESGGASVVGKTGATTTPAGPLGGNATAIVVSGEDFPDALSAGPASYAGHFPILLTTAATLSPEAKTALTNLSIKAVLVIGGTSAVSQATQDQIAAMNIAVTRIAGNDRTETATKVADYELANLGFVNTHADLARGTAFADALAGGPHSGKAKAPLLLTAAVDDIGNPTRSWLKAHAATLTAGHISGGTGAVSTAAETDARQAATTPASTSSTSSTTSTTSPVGLPTSTTSATSSTTTTMPAPPSLATCPSGTTGPGQPFCFTPSPSPVTTTTSSSTTSTSTTSTTILAGPQFTNAQATNGSNQLTLTYDQPPACPTVANNGSDYVINLVTGPGAPLAIAPGSATCSGFTVVLTLTSGTFQSGQTGNVTVKQGSDGNTVQNNTGQSQPAGSSRNFTVA